MIFIPLKTYAAKVLLQYEGNLKLKVDDIEKMSYLYAVKIEECN